MWFIFSALRPLRFTFAFPFLLTSLGANGGAGRCSLSRPALWAELQGQHLGYWTDRGENAGSQHNLTAFSSQCLILLNPI